MSPAATSSASARAPRRRPGSRILSLVLGAAAMAAGAGDAGMGIMMAGQQAAMGKFLAFTRAQETSRRPGRRRPISPRPGISGKGSLAFFKKLQNQEFRLAIYAKDSYDRTHPLSSERIAALSRSIKKDPAWDRPTDPALEARFQRVKAKLIGYVDPQRARPRYPESDQSVPARYARAYAYHLGAYPDKAAGGGRRAAADRARRSLLPRAEGPDPARIGPPGGSARCAARGGRAARPTSR